MQCNKWGHIPLHPNPQWRGILYKFIICSTLVLVGIWHIALMKLIIKIHSKCHSFIIKNTKNQLCFPNIGYYVTRNSVKNTASTFNLHKCGQLHFPSYIPWNTHIISGVYELTHQNIKNAKCKVSRIESKIGALHCCIRLV